MTKNRTLLVDKTKFETVEFSDQNLGSLEDGFIRISVGPWALTANNVTYMVTGERIGYWHYFAPQAYGIGDDYQGRMPVWGYARVTDSKCEGIKVGQEIYGFFPITQVLDMKPVKISRTGFQDGNEHRIPLHSLYNSYTMTDKDPSFGVHKDLQPILRPLFTTSFLIDDTLADEKFYGAEQVLVLSASSKTALGTAYCMKARGGIKVTGLTSKGNADFVKGTGFYHTVFDYNSISEMDASVKTVIVDMSGNGKLLQDLTQHFGESLVYICRVGLSHWDAGETKPVSNQEYTPKSEFFFAPDQANKRIKEWGGAGFAERLGARWLPFLGSASDWLSVSHSKGEAAVLETYSEVLSGQASPKNGYIFTL